MKHKQTHPSYHYDSGACPVYSTFIAQSPAHI